jgi:hypothetical protein
MGTWFVMATCSGRETITESPYLQLRYSCDYQPSFTATRAKASEDSRLTEGLIHKKFIAPGRIKETPAASDSTHGADKVYPTN